MSQCKSRLSRHQECRTIAAPRVCCESTQTYFLQEYLGLTPNFPTTFFSGDPSLAVTFFPAELERTVWFKDVALRAVDCCETQNASMEPATRAKANIIDSTRFIVPSNFFSSPRTSICHFFPPHVRDYRTRCQPRAAAASRRQRSRQTINLGSHQKGDPLEMLIRCSPLASSRAQSSNNRTDTTYMNMRDINLLKMDLDRLRSEAGAACCSLENPHTLPTSLPGQIEDS